MNKITLILGVLLSALTSARAQLGSATTDLVYTPVTPCRLFDTRPTYGGAGAIPAGGEYVFVVSGRSSYSIQGGSSTNCGMASVGRDARAIAIYLTVVTPAASGWITAYQNGVTTPAAATVNFKAGDVLGNTTIVPVTPGGGGSANNSLMNIYASSATNVVGDIVGYYSKPIEAGSLDCVVPTPETVSLSVGFDNVIFTNVACSAGYQAVSSFCWKGTASSVFLTGSGIQSGAGTPIPRPSAWCAWVNSSGTSQNVRQSTNCCRIPGR